MALINCSECGKSISDQAAACPHCGAPALGRKERNTRKAMWIITAVVGLPIVLFFGSAVIAGIAESVSGGGSSAKPQRPYTGRIRGEGIEYELSYAASSAGGECEGWNTVSVQKPGDPSSGMLDLMCWRQVGDQIEVNTATGQGRRKDPRSTYVD